MKKYIPLVLFIAFVLAAALLNNYLRRSRMPGKLPPIEVYFSPKGGCTDAIVQELEAAKETILVQAYSFTSERIAKALVDAARRPGMKVDIILDSDQETDKYSEADFLIHEGIPPLIDGKHAIAHNKIMIIDGSVVITGSFNFTNQAEQSNAENVLIIRDKDIAKVYTDNWQSHAAHCRAYQDKPKQERDFSGDRKPAKPRKTNPKAPERALDKTMKSLLN